MQPLRKFQTRSKLSGTLRKFRPKKLNDLQKVKVKVK